tara:strand:+ start:270 stop:575 length:306 start_codon:yes stop_codon:yes gene_type:complete
MRENLKKIFSLDEKVVIVTGSNRGNGLAIASGLKELGANVIRIDLSFEISNEIGTYDIKLDLRETKKIEDIVKGIYKKFGKIDGLVNNAGVSLNSKIHIMI